MAAFSPCIDLSDGRKMPLVGLGTWQGSTQADDELVAENVRLAIDVGYRLVDTAQMYYTEPGVGRGIRSAIEKGTVTREDVFVTTKVWSTHHRRPDVVRHLRKSLDRLGLDYVDLYLIHWPCALKPVEEDIFPKDAEGRTLYDEEADLLDTWRGMEDAVDQGLARSIGVSNFNKRQLERVLANCRITPVNNQVEGNLGFQNLKLIEFCHSRGISVTAYRSMLYVNDKEGFSVPDLDAVKRIADRHGKTVQQVAQKYQVQRGIAVIPKSSREERLRENIQLFDFELTDEDMAALGKLDTKKRSFDVIFKESKEYPFSDEY